MKKHLLLCALTLLLSNILIVNKSFTQDNLITNPGFEDGVLTPWEEYQPSNPTSTGSLAITSDANSGTNACLVDITASAGTVNHYNLRTPIISATGTDVVASFWAKAAGGTIGASIKLQLVIVHDAGTKYLSSNYTLTDTYTQYTYSKDLTSLATPLSGIESIRYVIQCGAAVGQIYVDDAVLQDGTAAGVTYDLTTSVVGNGRIDPESGSFAENSDQTITAIPFFGNEFTGWSGDLTGTTNPTTLTMDAAKNVTATFAPIQDFDYIWHFNTDGDPEGWTGISTTSTVASGAYNFTVEAANSKIQVIDIAIPTDDYAALEIRLRNNTSVAGTDANPIKINAETATGGSYRKLEETTANETEFNTYQLTLGNGPNYVGNVSRLQILAPKNDDGTATTGSIDIDYVKFIKKLNQTITFDALADAELGDTVILNKSTDGGLTITYESSDSSIIDINKDTLFMAGIGSATITASQAGDSYYYPAADVVQSGTVTKVAQTITFDALAGKSVGDADFELTATASSGLAVTYTSSDLNVATISGSTVTIVGAGSTTITASQAGDDTYNAAPDVSQQLLVSNPSLSDQTITFDALPDKTIGDADFDLTATASSGLTVTYSSSDETVATISGSTVTIVGAGTTTITASQAGDATYNAAPDVTQTLTVNKVEQTITFDALADKTIGDADFDLVATASSGLTVTYTSSDETVATISGSTVTIVGAGTTTITASQAGDATYNAAPDVTQTLTVIDPYVAPTFTSTAVTEATVDAAYEYQATIQDGNGTGTFSISSTPDASAWLGIDATSGLVSGTPSETGTFAITIGYDDGRTSITQNYDLLVSGGTAIGLTNAAEVSMYPNPAIDVIYISNVEGAKVSIIDLTGKTLINETGTELTEINIESLHSGMYLVSIQYNNAVQVMKLKVQ